MSTPFFLHESLKCLSVALLPHAIWKCVKTSVTSIGTGDNEVTLVALVHETMQT